MNGDLGPMPGDDLFDLPSEAGSAKSAGRANAAPSSPDLDALSSALPRRPQAPGPAGPPISSVNSNAAAILEQVRRPPTAAESRTAASAPTPAQAGARIPRALWIAFGALALVNALVLGFVALRGGPPPADAHAPAQPASASALPLGGVAPDTRAQAEAKPIRREDAPAQWTESELPTVPAHELARRSLRDAEADLSAGRRAAARARLGRIGLSIDAIDAEHREDIRAEVALLLARSIQDDVDEAARTKR